MWRKYLRCGNIAGLSLLVLAVCFARVSYAQPFSSGSTGTDGALNLTTPGMVLFDPKTFHPPLDPAGDNVFNFTTITIGPGVTLRLSGNILNGPVFFLASGDVQIAGTIDLSGDPGHHAGNNLSDRIPAAPGPGGYAGGVGGIRNATNAPPEPGNGPGGSPVSNNGAGGTFTGSPFLIPLIGGSGGAGTIFTCGTAGLLVGGGGGAGAGAMLIASSTSITVNGTINANGGAAGEDGGSGSGGAVRLMAPVINGTGLITAAGVVAPCFPVKSGDGRIRLEAFQQNFAGTFNNTPVSLSPPFKVPLPATPPSSIRVASIAGMPINANPFKFPDAVINSNSPIPITIEAHFVPLGTIPTLVILSEIGGDQVVTAPALQGSSLQLSTSTVNVKLPAGGSRGYVKATW